MLKLEIILLLCKIVRIGFSKDFGGQCSVKLMLQWVTGFIQRVATTCVIRNMCSSILKNMDDLQNRRIQSRKEFGLTNSFFYFETHNVSNKKIFRVFVLNETHCTLYLLNLVHLINYFVEHKRFSSNSKVQ